MLDYPTTFTIMRSDTRTNVSESMHIRIVIRSVWMNGIQRNPIRETKELRNPLESRWIGLPILTYIGIPYSHKNHPTS
jgi:hypothetical protein